MLGKLQAAADFFASNSDSTQSFEYMADVYDLFSAPHAGAGQDATIHRIKKIATTRLVRPASVRPTSQSCTSVVVRFTDECDDEDIVRWSPFLVAWPSGHFGDASLSCTCTADFSPPEEGPNDVTITVPTYLFEGFSQTISELSETSTEPLKSSRIPGLLSHQLRRSDVNARTKGS